MSNLLLPSHWQHHHYPEIDSTMNAAELLSPPAEGIVLVTAGHQTAGHGQRGTRWESAPETNLLFSFALRHTPHTLQSDSAFLLSEVLCLALCDTVLPHGICPTVKWPNDLYVDDCKLAGVLVRHNMSGTMLATSLIGVGMNVGQRVFVSDAPNPISLHQLTGQDYDRPALLSAFCRSWDHRYAQLLHATAAERAGDAKPIEALQSEYHRKLYGRGELRTYRDVLTGETFLATPEHVARQGLLHLRTETGELRTYAFKEVELVIPHWKNREMGTLISE